MTETEIQKYYDMIKSYHSKHLKYHNIKLPELKTKAGLYIKDSLVLVFLSKNYPKTEVVSKDSLTQFVKRFYPNTTDVQQARHLSRQKGWNILSGQRGDISMEEIPSGSYKLMSLETPYPSFNSHRVTNYGKDYWESLKETYENRCASCGSTEGEKNFVNPSTITQLQQGHMNPELPLIKGNVIPQCQECNRSSKNNWIYDARGRVVGLTTEALFARIKSLNKTNATVAFNFLQKKFNLK